MSEIAELIGEVAPTTTEKEIVFDDTEVAKADAARDLAWRTGDQFTWHGKKLHPFAIDREGDWRAHRVALGVPELSSVLSEAFMSDALRIVWFCSHDPGQWLPFLRDPVALELKIRKWAAENVGTGEQQEITRLAIDIFNSAYKTRAQPADAHSLGES